MGGSVGVEENGWMTELGVTVLVGVVDGMMDCVCVTEGESVIEGVWAGERVALTDDVG